MFAAYSHLKPQTEGNSWVLAVPMTRHISGQIVLHWNISYRDWMQEPPVKRSMCVSRGALTCCTILFERNINQWLIWLSCYTFIWEMSLSKFQFLYYLHDWHSGTCITVHLLGSFTLTVFHVIYQYVYPLNVQPYIYHWMISSLRIRILNLLKEVGSLTVT